MTKHTVDFLCRQDYVDLWQLIYMKDPGRKEGF
jgi:hypothetical protein